MVKNNKLLKTLLVVAAIICIVSISGVVNADAFPTAIEGTETSFSSGLTNSAGAILGVFQVVGYAVAVIILAWLGIKYIMASPDGKAELKKQAFAYILGAVLLFAAGTIVGWVKGTIDTSIPSEVGSVSVQIENVRKV